MVLEGLENDLSGLPVDPERGMLWWDLGCVLEKKNK